MPLLRRSACSHRSAFASCFALGPAATPCRGVRRIRLTPVFGRHRRVRRAGPTRLPDFGRSAHQSVATSCRKWRLNRATPATSTLETKACRRQADSWRQRRRAAPPRPSFSIKRTVHSVAPRKWSDVCFPERQKQEVFVAASRDGFTAIRKTNALHVPWRPLYLGAIARSRSGVLCLCVSLRT